MSKYILVDFENVHESNYKELLSQNVHLKVFLGESQNKIPTELVLGIQDAVGLGRLIQISGNGKNALDFHIAYELGRLFSNDKNAECIIISKDTGYDPLIENIRKEFGKKSCSRIESIEKIGTPKKAATKVKTLEKKAEPKQKTTPKISAKADTILSLENTIKWLQKSSKNRPSSVDAFVKSVQNLAKPKGGIKKKQVETLLKDLESKKKLTISETGKINYKLL
ncbi:MAG: PIN domain-containing protein [Fibrobacter sp.]|nr:PIN domain-containing protein [Fibrobacter sp.]